MTDLKELITEDSDYNFLQFLEKWELPSYEFGLIDSNDLRSIFKRFYDIFEKLLPQKQQPEQAEKNEKNEQKEDEDELFKGLSESQEDE